MKTLELSLHLLPDRSSAALRPELRSVPIGDRMRSWMQEAVAALSRHPDLHALEDQGAVPDAGDLADIEIILCHPDDLGDIFEAVPGTLGIHQITTPDSDPFDDEAPHARAYRILIAFDEAAIARLVIEDWDADGFLDPEEAAMAWLATFGHEIHHVILFAENGNFNTPQDLDLMEEEIGYDLFDISTGYGIRPLVIEGEEIEPDTAEDARRLMEEMVEERGRRMVEDVLSGRISSFVSILEDRSPEIAP